jgi:hypothetical protein
VGEDEGGYLLRVGLGKCADGEGVGLNGFIFVRHILYNIWATGLHFKAGNGEGLRLLEKGSDNC